MSLRVRLVLVIVVLVTVVAVALSILHLDTLLNSLSNDALQRSDLVSQQVQSFVTDHINQHSTEYAAPPAWMKRWRCGTRFVSSDQDISGDAEDAGAGFAGDCRDQRRRQIRAGAGVVQRYARRRARSTS